MGAFEIRAEGIDSEEFAINHIGSLMYLDPFGFIPMNCSLISGTIHQSTGGAAIIPYQPLHGLCLCYPQATFLFCIACRICGVRLLIIITVTEYELYIISCI